MAQFTLQQALDLALQVHKSGQLREAAQLYQQILAQHPDHPDALHLLGLIALQEGNLDIALDLISRAIAISPNLPLAQFNLGNALKQRGQLEQAIGAFHRSIALNPRHAESHCNLGNALKDNGQVHQAIAAYHQAIALKPEYAEAYYNLGNALKENKRLDEAIAAYRKSIGLNPTYAKAHNNLGIALKETGDLAGSLAAFRQAVTLRPQDAEALCNIGNVLKDLGQIDEAIATYDHAIGINLNLPEAHGYLGNALKDKGRLDEAVASYRKAIELKPDYAEVHNNLGNVLKDKGQLDDAIAEYRKAIAQNPAYNEAHSNLAFAMLYHSDYDARAVAEENRRWNLQHAEALREFIKSHSNDRSPDRRLRIGYVSSDFREHVVGRNILPLFQQHDRTNFEIFCYAQVSRPDAMTRLLQQSTDAWRDIARLSDQELADQIRADQIDILMDLAGHTADNRLLAFARKPAPVQVTYLGSCGSTGMPAMDYRFSDPHIDPPDTDLSCYSEKTIRLPRSYWCYRPSLEPTPDPSPTPAIENRFITFGSLNNFAKISPAAQDLWAKILLAVPNSRMLIHAPLGRHRINLARRLERRGITKDRLHFVGPQPWTQYMQTYSQIDITLDPFPYGGNITACDALWMGVAVVTLSGQTAVGRGGRSILTNLGLPELIAYSEKQYIQIATDLAADLDRLSILRRAMRPRMLASPLMDAKAFARDVESAYRRMWRTWIAG